MDTKEFEQLKKTIPLLPGVYQFYNKDNVIIYIGKAIVLRNRVKSYFQSQHLLNRKTREMVSHINHFDWIACPSEHDALLLENNLIKKWQPRYNINLKDDKTYPYIVIRNEPFPRVYLTRRKLKDKNVEHYGPYTSVSIVRELLQYIRDEIPLRTCKLNLSEKAIAKNKYRPCLEYHIKKCNAPCVKYQTAQEYNENIEQVRMLLKGNFSMFISIQKKLMQSKAEAYQFEEAQLYKEKIDAINKFKHKSFFEFNAEIDLDIFVFKAQEDNIWINFAILRNGLILQSKVEKYHMDDDASIPSVASTLLFNIRQKFASRCSDIIVNSHIEIMPEQTKITIPKRGIKSSMIAWGLQNIEHHIINYKEQSKKEEKQIQLLRDIQVKLKMPALPSVVESFDNSHFQGSSQVSCMVSFKNGFPNKKEYRTFHIKSTDKIDDYASMREVIHRRYLRRINEGKSLPNLILIDGGKGQLNEAFKSLEQLGLSHKITIVSIAKKHEHLFFPGDKEPFVLEMNSPILRFFQQVRDETHRFAIGFHRKSQIKKTIPKS